MNATDEKRYLELLAKYKKMIYSVCRMYGDTGLDSVEDLYHEVACSLWTEYCQYGLGRFKHRCSESTWMYAFTKYTVMYHLHQNKSNNEDVELYSSEMLDLIIDESSLSQEEVESLNERVQELLLQLPPYDKELICYKLQGCSYSEIASKMGLSETAVGTRLSRIMERLRKQNKR